MAATRARLVTLMAPSSANTMGNVHGGNILRMCEEAGRIVTTRWSRGPVALVGASGTEFREPVHVGEVATVSAELDYVARHVMRVSMTVEAERMETGRRRVTNRAAMWYSTVDVGSADGGAGGTMTLGSRPLHPLHPSQVAPDAAAEHRASSSAAAAVPLASRPQSEFPVVLQVTPGVDSVSIHPFVSAGYILKLMDTGGAMAAISHARHPCVTVLLDKVCFHTPIRIGDLCTVRSGVTFTSSRSIEVVVQVWTSRILDGVGDAACTGTTGGPVCAVEARFVFVALGADGSVMPVPELPPEKQRTKRWAVGAGKHKERVAERAKL